MAGILHPNVLDNGLAYAKMYADMVYLCSTQPTTFEQAVNAPIALGYKNCGTGAVFPNAIVEVAGVGRKIIAIPITDGITVLDGTVTYWAVVYSTGGILLATQNLDSAVEVHAGQPWTTSEFSIQLDYPST